MIRIILAIVFLCNLLFGVSLTKEEQEWLKNNSFITVGYSNDFKPLYIEKNNQEVEGIIPDLYEIIASKLNIKINYVTKPWKEVLQETKEGKIDVVPMMFQQTALEHGLLPTDKIYTHLLRVYGKKGTTKLIFSQDDIKNLRIAYVKNILVLNHYLEKYKKENTLVEANNTFDAFNKVLNNQADIAIVFNESGAYEIKTNYMTEMIPLYTINDLIINSVSAVSPDSPILHSIISKVNESISYEEKLSIFKKWSNSIDHHSSILTKEEQEEIAQNYFNIYTGNWEPFTISTKNSIEGISIDIWEAISSVGNLKYSYFKVENFNEMLERLKKDKHGIILATSSSKERETFATFTKTILSFPIGLATNLKEDFIIDFTELNGKRVAVGNNYSAHILLKEHYPNIDFVPVKSTLEALHLLNKGEVYAAADILPVLIYNMNKYNLSNLKISGTSKFSFDVKLMINKENEAVIPILNKLIDSISSSEKQKIFQRWVETKEIIKTDYTYVYLLAIISLLIIASLMLRHKVLKKSEEAIKKERYKYQSLMNYSSDMVFIMDLEGNLLEYSKQVQTLLGYTDDEMKMLSVFDWDKDLSKEDFEHIVKNLTSTPLQLQRTHIKKDKTTYEADIQAVKINVLGVEYIYATARDITKLKQLEHEIIKEKEEFKSIFKHSTDGMAITDLKTNFLDFNDAYLKITGFTREELLTKSSLGLASSEHKAKMQELVNTVIETGHIENYEKESIIKEEKRIFVNMSITLLPDKKRLLIIAKDVTSLKQLEDQTKLIAMGEMIGNIAHQWRQPLSVITTAISGISIKNEMGVLDTQDINTTKDIIIKQAEYLSTTIENFRNFIKEDKKVKLISLNDALHNTISLVQASLQNNFIRLIPQMEDDLIILGNKNELTEAFINIINNSKDVLIENYHNEESRLIFIKTRKIDEKSLEIQFLDSGGGLDKAVIGRILEPYFTTKHKSQGTGLGLSIADKIIRERHKGIIDIFNQEFEFEGKTYKGLCFSVIFYYTENHQ